jgi:type II restriction/modification system DNA methylase subunit YeeA
VQGKFDSVFAQYFQEQKDIEQFIRFHTVSPLLAEKENAVLLNQKLDDIKVCDPAIGSGAFPIGMLQEIFEAKRFIYPYGFTNLNLNQPK